MPVGLWNISHDGPQRLERSGVGLEQHLEDWIERDPGILQTRLTIIGRQVQVEGGRLAPLGLDMEGGQSPWK